MSKTSVESTARKAPIPVQVLEETPTDLRITVPFLDIPIRVTQSFFNKRLQAGYFKLQEPLGEA